jgi:Uma2 family endonuclease
MNMHAQAKMSFDEFARWAESQQRKHELVRGEVRLLPYVKFAHTKLSSLLTALLHPQIDKTRFALANGDFAIRTGPDTARFADVAIVPASTPADAGFTAEPVVVIEVLSQSTMHADFGEKRLEYQALSSLKAYLILSQHEPAAWRWQRGADGAWPADPERLEGREGEISLAAVSASLPMAELYAA